MPRTLTFLLIAAALVGCTNEHIHHTAPPPAPAPPPVRETHTEVRETKESSKIIEEGTEVRELPGDRKIPGDDEFK